MTGFVDLKSQKQKKKKEHDTEKLEPLQPGVKEEANNNLFCSNCHELAEKAPPKQKEIIRTTNTQEA